MTDIPYRFPPLLWPSALLTSFKNRRHRKHEAKTAPARTSPSVHLSAQGLARLEEALPWNEDVDYGPSPSTDSEEKSHAIKAYRSIQAMK